MSFDIRTLVIITGIASLLQVMALFLQYRLNRAHQGIGWWLLGFVSMVMGYGFIAVRGLISIKLITIIIANLLIILGPICLYIGIMLFLNEKVNRSFIVSIVVVFLLSFSYYTYFDDNITLRTVIVYAVAGFFSLLTAQRLFLYKTRLIIASAYFNAALFLINGCFFAFRAIETLTIDPVHGLFTPTLMQTVSFLVLFVYGILLTFGLIIMVNQRLNAENSEAKENLELTFNTSPDAVLVTRLPDGYFVLINDGFTVLTGYTRTEIIGKSSLDINIWKSPEERQQFITALIEKGFCENMETVFQHKDGSQIIAMVSARIFTLQDVPHIISVSRDITEQKKVEAQKAELETQNRQLQKSESLGRMAAAIAHHFNNKLGAVIGNLELAMMELPKDAKPQARISAAMEASGTAAEMSRLMLTYLGQSHDKRVLLNLCDACHSSLPLLQAIMPVNVVLEKDLPSPGPIVSTTSAYIQQILTNLVTNASEAIGDGRGTITMSVKTVSPAKVATVHRHPIDWQPQSAAYACLEVSDTGSGIEDKDIEALFDPFFSTKFTGRGMGLAVVLGIVKTHNGVLTVESKPKQGSAFRVFLPLSEDALNQM